MPREGSKLAGALSGDGDGHLLVSPVRKQRLSKSKEELVAEAARVISEVDKLDCISSENGVLPEKFYTLPARRKHKSPFAENSLRRRSSFGELTPPKKPPRTFAHSTPVHKIFQDDTTGTPVSTSTPTKPKKSNLRRSVSDASALKTPQNVNNVQKVDKSKASTLKHQHKKQLSPIIEVTPREDYFSNNLKLSTSFKENDKNVENEIIKPPARKKKDNSQNVLREQPKQSVTEKLKEYIDEVDSGFKNDQYQTKKIIESEVVVIDVDKAKNISPEKPRPKLGTALLGKKLKSITSKKGKNKKVKEAIESLTNATNKELEPAEMIHSSQQPAEKLPLTRGCTVDTMVKRLSHECSSPPPPKTNVMITPNISVQHNNNQPFSYTRGLSPERTTSTPIIYAQVVHGTNGNGNKQTIHTTYNGKKQLQHSDSDEGLGYEENTVKHTTHFGDDKCNYNNNEPFDEYPITPKFKPNGYNMFSNFENKYNLNKIETEHGMFIDSSSRGRGDGMDSNKRRESLTEQENGLKDLSARRDMLESRINRRFGDKIRTSPDYSPKNNVYLQDTNYYRSGSVSPLGFKDKHVSERKTDQKYIYNADANGDYKIREYRYNSYDNEPKSFDSQISDYRSSPETKQTSHNKQMFYNKYQNGNAVLTKNREFYKSNPEIHQRNYENRFRDEYHKDERKDKFGDSGIENDYRRDSDRRKRRELSNESEDEGFASSLLIASERQHTEDGFSRKNRRSYESDKDYRTEEYHRSSYKNKTDYVPRERSIDDGSHYDPHIDREFRLSSHKKVDKKPPKPEKKSNLEKVKQLFTGRKKKDKAGMVREESLRARYVEYKGDDLKPNMYKKSNSEAYEYNNNNTRRRLSTPNSSPTHNRSSISRDKREPAAHNGTSWFKSLDRLSHKKSKRNETSKEGNMTSTEDETTKPMKNLRFFGDTDNESNDSERRKSGFKSSRGRSQSSRDLHNIVEESYKTNHKSMLNISSEPEMRDSRRERDVKGSRLSLKPPASPLHRTRDHYRSRDDRIRRRKNEVSSVESSTEGDSSQQSQRSIVYLHAATVGDIPGPGYLKNGRRAASREELASNSSSRLQPHTKTLSRSFSVLAPWRPRHYKESMDIDYTQYPKAKKYEQNKNNNSSRKESSTLLKKKAQETRRSNQNISTTLNRRSRSKENISGSNSTLKRASESKGSSSSLYKKKDRQPKENNRYNRDDKRSMVSKSMSVESLGSNRSGRKSDREVSRSISMPRDPEKSAGWFNINKRSKKSISTHRL
jgi:hypothetical protein